MTWLLMFLYLAIGAGCGALRLSALAVALLTILPAALGAYAGYSGGWLQVLLMAVAPIVLIECSYFVTMLVMARISDSKAARPSKASPPTVGLSRKSRIPPKR